LKSEYGRMPAGTPRKFGAHEPPTEGTLTEEKELGSPLVTSKKGGGWFGPSEKKKREGGGEQRNYARDSTALAAGKPPPRIAYGRARNPSPYMGGGGEATIHWPHSLWLIGDILLRRLAFLAGAKNLSSHKRNDFEKKKRG